MRTPSISVFSPIAAMKKRARILAGPEWRDRMNKYVIEREIPDIGKMTPEELQAASKKSCGVLDKMAPRVQWLESFVTDDKMYCVYLAPDEEAVREHAWMGGFPANRISAVKAVIDPTTAGS
jgi:hypothetical protein